VQLGIHRHFRRLRAEGIGRFLLYLLGVGLLQRLGIRVYRVYEYVPQSTTPVDRHKGGVDVSIVSSLTELGREDLAVFAEYGGPRLVADFVRAFGRGQRCAIGRPKDANHVPGCVCWLVPAQSHAPIAAQQCTVIQRCFTLPAWRGRGLYPETLRLACEHLAACAPAGARRILIEASVFNSASVRAIERAGFQRKATVARIWRWKRVWEYARDRSGAERSRFNCRQPR